MVTYSNELPFMTSVFSRTEFILASKIDLKFKEKAVLDCVYLKTNLFHVCG